jgi:hypothetical protein
MVTILNCFEKTEKYLWRFSQFTFSVTDTIDTVQTIKGIELGFKEIGPIATMYTNDRTAVWFAHWTLNIATLALGEIIYSQNKTLGWIFMGLQIGLKVYLIINNHRTLQRGCH